MTDKPIRLRGDISNDYFGFEYNRKSTKTLKDYIDMFNVDDYWIYKYSNKQKLVSVEEFITFINMGYMLFRKDKYDKEYINLWLREFFYKGGRSGIQFLVKPTPPFDPEKIKIKK